MIFREWSFSGGTFHHGPKKDTPIKIRHAKPGKLAFFTTKRFGMPEEDRIVIGCFKISVIAPTPAGEPFVISDPGTRICVRNFGKAPRFWKFHKQSSGPRWGTGLFRYLPNSEAMELYDALKAAGR
jgi:hypothetical protein